MSWTDKIFPHVDLANPHSIVFLYLCYGKSGSKLITAHKRKTQISNKFTNQSQEVTLNLT